LKLRQFNLQLAFPGMSALRKDIQDELGPVYHADTHRFFQVPKLGSREVVRGNHERGPPHLHLFIELLYLALADVEVGVLPQAPLMELSQDNRSRA